MPPDDIPRETPLARPGLSWSGTVDYGPGPLHAPTSVPELQALVGRSRDDGSERSARGTRSRRSRQATVRW